VTALFRCSRAEARSSHPDGSPVCSRFLLSREALGLLRGDSPRAGQGDHLKRAAAEGLLDFGPKIRVSLAVPVEGRERRVFTVRGRTRESIEARMEGTNSRHSRFLVALYRSSDLRIQRIPPHSVSRDRSKPPPTKPCVNRVNSRTRRCPCRFRTPRA
jgi:hypothetical protein